MSDEKKPADAAPEPVVPFDTRDTGGHGLRWEVQFFKAGLAVASPTGFPRFYSTKPAAEEEAQRLRTDRSHQGLEIRVFDHEGSPTGVRGA
jgi:hypothetical protein